MLRVILKWGAISGALMSVFLLITYFAFPGLDGAQYQAAEIAGYVGMLVSLSVIYIAIASHFSAANAEASVWARVKLGLGVAFVAGIIFGIFDTVYVNLINPDFMQDYFDYYASQLPVASGPETDAARAELEAQFVFFSSPPLVFLVMAATVWAVGIPVSIASALAHKYFANRQEK